jgi:hypothetical protein|tara:strand:+ start:4568 stop:5875 length:1308 start_codon:yes stop_codon:yes gene_type:complete
MLLRGLIIMRTHNKRKTTAIALRVFRFVELSFIYYVTNIFYIKCVKEIGLVSKYRVMDGEITLNRSHGNVLKLDDNEQALMDEIEIEVPRPRTSLPKPTVYKPVTRPPPMENAMQEDIDAFANPTKQSAPPQYQEDPVDYGEYDQEEEQQPYIQGDYAIQEEERPSPGYKSIDEEKADLVNKLGRLEKKGFTVNKRLNAYSGIDDLRTEVRRITYSIDVEKSIKFSRRMLIACCTGLEFLNKKYNPFEIQLDGWSENVMESVDDYDEVFEELYVKYRSKVAVAPEIKLIMMLGGSAMMFHLTNSMFKSVMPNMNDILKQNPGLVQNMVDAVKNTTPRNTETPAGEQAGEERYEMKGPGVDISSLMGNIMMPPVPPMSTTAPQPIPNIDPDDDDDAISDIVDAPEDVEEDSDVKEVKVSTTKGKRGRKKKSVEINL